MVMKFNNGSRKHSFKRSWWMTIAASHTSVSSTFSSPITDLPIHLYVTLVKSIVYLAFLCLWWISWIQLGSVFYLVFLYWINSFGYFSRCFIRLFVTFTSSLCKYIRCYLWSMFMPARMWCIVYVMHARRCRIAGKYWNDGFLLSSLILDL